jgi:hypothetical protein
MPDGRRGTMFFFLKTGGNMPPLFFRFALLIFLVNRLAFKVMEIGAVSSHNPSLTGAVFFTQVKTQFIYFELHTIIKVIIYRKQGVSRKA